MKRFHNVIDEGEMNIILELKNELAMDKKYFLEIPFKNETILRFRFNDAELHYLWERFSGTQCAQFLIVTPNTVKEFKKWIEEE